jgi:tetratricopeptide (TPR) repeat protein
VADTIRELGKENPDDVVNELAYHYFNAKDERAGQYLVRAGDMARERYANEEAIRIYENSLNVVDEVLKPEIKRKMASVHVLIGEYEKAIDYYVNLKEEDDDPRRKANLYCDIAWIYEKKSEFKKSIDESQSGLDLLGDEECIEKARLLSAQSSAYIGLGDLHNANLITERNVSIAEALGAKKEIAQAYHLMGIVQDDYGNSERSLEYNGKAMAIREEIGDIVGLSRTLNNTGLVYRMKSEYDKALEFFERSLEITEKMGDKLSVSGVLNNIGLVLINKGALDRALECHRQSLRIKEKIGHKAGYANSLYNLGTVYYYKGELDRSLECHEKSRVIKEGIGNKFGIANSLNSIGLVHLSMDDPERALEYFNHALDISLETSFKHFFPLAYLSLAETYLVELMEQARLLYESGMLFKVLGKPDKAHEQLQNARELFEDIGMRLWEEKCKRALEGLQ